MHPFKPSTSIHLFLNQQFNGGLLRLWRSCLRNRETVNLSPKKTGRLGWAACFLMACANKATWPQSALTTPFRVRRSVNFKVPDRSGGDFFFSLNLSKKSQVFQWDPWDRLKGIGLSYATLFFAAHPMTMTK